MKKKKILNYSNRLVHTFYREIEQPPLDLSQVLTFRKNDIEHPTSDKTDLYKIEFWLPYSIYVEWVWTNREYRDSIYDVLLYGMSYDLFPRDSVFLKKE